RRVAGGSTRPGSWWIGPRAKRFPASVWHFPQVAASFLGWIVDCVSEDGRILWTPWQLAQLAAVSEPARAASPGKGGWERVRRGGGRPNREVRRMSPWQRAQVSRIWRT